MIGIDIIKVSRIEDLINKFNEKGLLKFLSKQEILISNKKIETIAGFWSVKEAISKALGVGIGKDLNFHDIEIYKNSKNAPKVKLSDEVIEKFNINDIDISISHDGGFAIGVAIIQKK